jgi:hypothetical protein
MKKTIQILMSRDGFSKDEAITIVKNFFKNMQEDIVSGGDPFEWENEFVQEFGLEPDYFEDFLFALC